MTPDQAYTQYRIEYLTRKAQEATDQNERANYLKALRELKPVNVMDYLVEEQA